MPKAVSKTHKLSYPAGCRELSEELNNLELVKRLKLLARAFQEMGQEENDDYKQLALYLASEFFMEHQSKDVRLLVACCIADIFRIFAPEAPYTEGDHLKTIFLFLTQQLKGLADTESPSFKRYFYLLENLAWVKPFNICIELDDSQEIFCKLYKLMFNIVSEKHSSKVINFMLDMMCPLILEADIVSQELLDIILQTIIEPHKTQLKHTYGLAKELLKRTANAIEPYVQNYFNNALMVVKDSENDMSSRMYDMIYELNNIAPSVLLSVLPQLEFKLKSSEESERRSVTKLLSKLFSAPDSDLAIQNKPLWLCFLGRYNDIDVTIRRFCVQTSPDFLINHPELVKDITEHLKQRQRDVDENVRTDVVKTVVDVAKKDLSLVPDDLLECVKERTLDKKFKIRKEALQGLGYIYRRCAQKDDKEEMERVAWIRNKILYAYYQQSLDDRIMAERVLNAALVPYSLEPDERMKRLYILYGNVDELAVKALQEIFKQQMNLRNLVRSLMEMHQSGGSDDFGQMMTNRLVQLARNLPDSAKAQDYMKKFNLILKEQPRIRGLLTKLVSPGCPCKKAEEYVKEILKKMGNPIPQNFLYTHVKVLLERIAPVMIDSDAIQGLLNFVDDAVRGLGEISEEVPNATEAGMKLLLMLSHVYPGAFQTEEVYTQLMSFVKHEDDLVSDITMEVFSQIGEKLHESHPNIYTSLLPVLQKMVKIGTPKQAKHAIKCIESMCKNKDKIYAQIFQHLKKNMDIDSPNFLTALVSIGHIAQLCPGQFSAPVKDIVSKFVVKELLMQDRGQSRRSNESWYAHHLVSEETQGKIQALKMMVRWLLGMKSNVSNSCTSTLRLLHTMIIHDGDLMENGKINKAEMARLRLQAASCMLKLAQETGYTDLVTYEQFQTLALLINDPSYQVRLQFLQNLHKGLQSLRLPLQYLSIFSLASNDPLKERRTQAKTLLVNNITRRREYLKQNTNVSGKMFRLLPDYVLPYTIHLLAHDPDLRSHDDVESLKNIKDCLWFIMEPLITKNENYSFSFYKKMIENIKQTKDKYAPDDQEANWKLYAVCDLALGLVLTKTPSFVLMDFPAEPILPAKLFTDPDPSYSNTKSYLPKELMFQLYKTKKAIPGFMPPAQIASVTTSGVVAKEGRASGGASPPPDSRSDSRSEKSESVSSRSSSPTSVSPPGQAAPSRGKPGRPPGKSAKHKSSRGQAAAARSSVSDSMESLSDGEPGKCGTRATRSNSSTSVGHSRLDDRGTSTRKKGEKEDCSPENFESKMSPPTKKQGKITDFVKRTTLSNKEHKKSPTSSNDSSQSTSCSKDSFRSPTLSPPVKNSKSGVRVAVKTHKLTGVLDVRAARQTRSIVAAESPRNKLRKRAPSPPSSPDPTPTKKYKPSPHKDSRASRSLQSDFSSEISSTISTPRKRMINSSQSSLDSPAKRTTGRRSSSLDVSSPGSTSSKTSSSSSTPSKKNLFQRRTASTSSKSNVRKAPPMVNGTSNKRGRGRPPLSSGAKSKAAALAKAIREQSKDDSSRGRGKKKR